MEVGHKQFDRCMELLCLMPGGASKVPILLAAADLEVKGIAGVMRLVQKLRRAGFEINVGNWAGSRMMWMPTRAWPVARTAAQVYWDTVYTDRQA